MEKRTIAELITLYELENVRDVYVEGPTDRAFIHGFLRRTGVDYVQVREIDLVNISADEVSRLGLSSGNRQRVIALALLLDFGSPLDFQQKVCCIVDADDEAYDDSGKRECPLLLYTDATSMTTYAFHAPYLQWYFDVSLLGFPLTGSQTIDALRLALSEAAAARHALRTLNIHSALVDIARDCSWNQGSVTLDVSRFTTRVLDKAQSANRRLEFEASMSSARQLFGPDPRRWANAEDIYRLLHWLIVQLRRVENSVDASLLERTLLLGIPPGDVIEWPMFSELMSRLQRAS